MARRARANALVLLGYAAVSFAYFGWPIAAHPERDILGAGRDPQIFIWSFAWWPHALAAGTNPFFSRVIFAPDGINLAWTTTVPALALVFSPLTLLVGPVASYNVAALLMPALAAWSAYLLCRALTGSWRAALVGGYLFGFSSYMLGEELGHLHLTAVFCIPLVTLSLLRFLRGERDGRGLAWRLGLLLALQLWLSTEVLFTLTLALGLSGGLAFWLVPDLRVRLRALVAPVAGAYTLAALLSAPLLYYALTGFESGSINDPALFNGDLLNIVLPTRLVALGGSTFAHLSGHFPASDAERGAYLGLPTMAIVAWYAVSRRRARSTWFLIASLGVVLFFSLGTALEVEGRSVVSLPWRWLAAKPLFDNVLPVRLSLYASLVAAIVVALWTANRGGLLGTLLPLLAVAAVVPALWQENYRTDPERWPFFTTGEYKLCIPRGENVAIFPYGFWDNSMLWQAETGFWFRMAEGYLRPKPPPYYVSDPTVMELTYTTNNPTMAQILAFVRDKKVDRIISVDIYVHPNGNQMHRFGAVQDLGGVLVAPACGYPSLQTGVHPTPTHP